MKDEACAQNKVSVGSRVTVRGEEGESTFEICGIVEKRRYIRMGGAYDECVSCEITYIGEHIENIENHQRNVISKISPLGAALLGKQAGDSVRIKLPNKAMKEYQIISVVNENNEN